MIVRTYDDDDSDDGTADHGDDGDMTYDDDYDDI